MSRYIEKIEKLSLPLIATRTVAAFPQIPVSFELTRPSNLAALEAAKKNGGLVFAVPQRDPSEEDPIKAGLYNVGTVAKIKQSLVLPDRQCRVILDCLYRAELADARRSPDGVITAEVFKKEIDFDDTTLRAEALRRRCLKSLGDYCANSPKLSKDVLAAVGSMTDSGLMADYIAANFLVRLDDKALILSVFDPVRRLRQLLAILERENEILELENSISAKVKEGLDRHQREYYLQEQLKVIQNELGGDSKDDLYSDVNELNDKIDASAAPEYVREKLYDQTKKLARMPFGSSEASLVRSYVEECLEIPWGVVSPDSQDIEKARRILDRDHQGLEKVKERILEYLAAKLLAKSGRGQIICLVGAPGVGKTSVGASIARAMGRKYVRVSLGGVRDEADIRGHRKTYIGAMPGRIINALKQAGTMNPVIALDEIDKLSRSVQGDPGSALLEVLDSEQNHAFRDHFIEIPVDLSGAVFIATANTTETIPPALLDRLEVINIPSYTPAEKLAICKKHLIPKQMKLNGLERGMLKISDKAILKLIDEYTREQGVRTLDRAVAKLCRKAAIAVVKDKKDGLTVSAGDLEKLMGKRTVKRERASKKAEVGVVNGLAWTMSGGELLKAEVLSMPGTGKLELTGSLGDVMKESARAALSLIRSRGEQLGIRDREFYKNLDIHIHFPEGAVPKDGPSAGVTVVTALVSELSGVPVKGDVAMTGEITLRGKVLPIGGLREKTAAALEAGMKTVIIPEENRDDLDEVDESVKKGLDFVFARDISTVLDTALVERPEADGAGN
ncbi:MAG: endopeptidase La [Clostridia bacterium]|nr:endopeptidase La [Clostridia bacterium]